MAKKTAKTEPWKDFDFDSIYPDQIPEIVAYVEGMASDEAKLKWIDRFLDDYEFWAIDHELNAYLLVSGVADKLRALKARIQKKEVTEIAALNSKSDAISCASRPVEEIEDDPTTAGQVMAVYYLLQAANVGSGWTLAEMGRLVCFLTGKKHPTIKRYWQNPLGNPDSRETRKNRELIRGIFQKLDLKKALELMDKDEN